MRTLKLTLEYDGSAFSGWQIQPHKRTVQGTIQDVLRKITQEDIKLVGASRTDAGVHALGQVAHFRTKSRIRPEKFLIALNGLLPPEVAVKSVEESDGGFHAIRSAQSKTYRYVIWNEGSRSALERLRAWHVWDPLNLGAMRRAAKALPGRHDFSAFRGAQSDTKTSVRRVERVTIQKKGPEVRVEITGEGFLKYMVRNIVGTLVDVGKGRVTPKEFRKILQSRDRKKAGATAPAFGLTLVSIRY
ncbi:MAG TPA: tRNA pseudouridine(38-40) synthase TruA [bacterium]|nr:tRNA pseudouridine(38-40) synthase TruA [bacterium]